MSTYCAPCLTDLALVREAVTAVGGTAVCTAHAVLLSHPGDHPQRRLTRLGDLRTLAEGKLADASPQDAPALELLVQEYALAGAMDMTVPLKELAGDRSPRPPKTRRNRPGRGDRPEGERHDRPEGERRDRPEGERRDRPEGERRDRLEGERRDRPEGERRDRLEGERRDRVPRPPRGDRPSNGTTVPATDAGVHVPGAGPTSQDSAPAPVRETQAQGSVPSAPVPAPTPDAPSAPVPAPTSDAPSAPVPAPTSDAPSAPAPAPTPDAPSTPQPPQQDSAPVQSTAPADSSAGSEA